MMEITKGVRQSGDWHTELGNWGRRRIGDSNLLCSEYDDRADQAANETDSWEWDHSCNTGSVTADGKYLGDVDTFSTDGIQGRHIAEYFEQRRTKVGMLPNYFLCSGV